MEIRQHFSCLILLAAFALPSIVHAEKPSDSAICGESVARQERLGAIPKDILNAISQIESGRKTAKDKAISAWPWTVNVAGKGYYFDSKEKAINFVQLQQAQGIKSIDVGCMQINLHYHKEAFKDLNEAFDPETNTAYAAEFLSDLYREHKSWLVAVGHYHSATPAHNIPYRNKVAKKLASLQDDPAHPMLADKRRVLPQVVYPRTANLPVNSARYTNLTIFEIDAKRKAAVMAAWEARKKAMESNRQRLQGRFAKTSRIALAQNNARGGRAAD